MYTSPGTKVMMGSCQATSRPRDSLPMEMLTQWPPMWTPEPSGVETPKEAVTPGFNPSTTAAMPSIVRMAAPALEPEDRAESDGASARQRVKAAAMYAAHPKLEEDEDAGRLGHQQVNRRRTAIEAHRVHPSGYACHKIALRSHGRTRRCIAGDDGEDAVRAGQRRSRE